MKKCFTKVFSFFKRIFLFLKLHIHVEAGVKKLPNKDDEDNSIKED